jgi:hypothetical protein
MAPSTIQKLRIISLASGGLSMGQIALWKPFQFFLLGISPSVVNFVSCRFFLQMSQMSVKQTVYK